MANEPVERFLALGDIQYENGALSAFNTSYHKWFAPYTGITRPVPGNHEYRTPGASGYYNYYSAKTYAAPPGYYSFDIGNWHLVALNSNCAALGGCGSQTAQAVWLKNNLANTSNKLCTLAFWHHPRFNSGEHSGAANMTWAWNILDARNAEVILNGHEHSYQRFRPLNRYGNVNADGIVQFVSGAGGKNHYSGGATSQKSAFRNTTDFGMLLLSLGDSYLDYEWVTEFGVTKDSGTIECN